MFYRHRKPPQKEELNFDVVVEFINPQGICVADANGLTYILGTAKYTDPTLIYDEQYWGEYPLYLPGYLATILVSVTYNGDPEQANVSVINATYAINLDGSNGDLISGPDTHDITINDGATQIIDASLTIPLQPKGLYRLSVKILNEGEEIATAEGIFCPPEVIEQ